jgi:hypothetical protein
MLRSAITSPAALSNAIHIVRGNLDDGTLFERMNAASKAMQFSVLEDHGPWPDWFSFEFACSSCGERFELSAETFHGSGGEWRPLATG